MKTIISNILMFWLVLVVGKCPISAQSLITNDQKTVKLDSAQGYLFCLIDINDTIEGQRNNIYFSFLKNIPKSLLKTKKYDKIKNFHTSLFYSNDSTIKKCYIDNMRKNFIADVVAFYGINNLSNSYAIIRYMQRVELDRETLFKAIDNKTCIYTDSLLSSIFDYPVLFVDDLIYKKGLYVYFCKVMISYIYLEFEDKTTKNKSQYAFTGKSVMLRVNKWRDLYVKKSSISNDSTLIIPYKVKVLKQFD